MAALRTQIYLTTEQRERLDAIAQAEGSTLAGVIRDAVDQYLEHTGPDPATALEATFGVAPDFPRLDRRDWAERERRVNG